jgi:hypothetical protein
MHVSNLAIWRLHFAIRRIFRPIGSHGCIEWWFKEQNSPTLYIEKFVSVLDLGVLAFAEGTELSHLMSSSVSTSRSSVP